MNTSIWSYRDFVETYLRQGVSIAFLRKFVEANGGDENLSFTSTSEIYTDAISPHLIPFSSLQKVKRSYCEYLIEQKSEHVGPATVYCSHAWNSPFLSLVKALENHSASIGKEKSTFYWIDIFSRDCSNELPLNIQDSIMSSCSFFVMVLSPISMIPIPFKRLWCLYELFTAIHTKNLVIKMVMSTDDEQEFLFDLVNRGHDVLLRRICDVKGGGLNIETSCAFDYTHSPNTSVGLHSKEMESALRNCLFTKALSLSTSSMSVNELLHKQVIQSWLCDTLATYAHASCERGMTHYRDPNQVAYLEAIAAIKFELGLTEEALSLYQYCLRLYRKVFGVHCVSSGCIYSKIAAIFVHMQNYDNALSMYREALVILTKHRELIHNGIYHSVSIDNILMAIAQLYEKMNNYHLAEQHYYLFLDEMQDHKQRWLDRDKEYLRELRWERINAGKNIHFRKGIGLQQLSSKNWNKPDDITVQRSHVSIYRWDIEMGHAHSSLARVIMKSGRLYDCRLKKVKDHLHCSLSLYSKALGSNNIFVAFVYDLYATMHRVHGHVADAYICYKDSLFIKLSYGDANLVESIEDMCFLKKNHRYDKLGKKQDIIATITGVAECAEQMGADHEALAAYEKALDMAMSQSDGQIDANSVLALKKGVLRLNQIVQSYK